MPKVTLLIGLPGSGKSYLGNKLSSNFIDDPKVRPVLNGKDLVVADLNFCIEKNRESAINYFEERGYIVECVYFENNPKKCKKNVEYRDDGRKVLCSIDIYSKLYKIPKNVVPISIWQKGESCDGQEK